MAVARFCSAGVAMRYVLPVLRMTSCLHTMAGVGELKNKIIEIKKSDSTGAARIRHRGVYSLAPGYYVRGQLAQSGEDWT